MADPVLISLNTITLVTPIGVRWLRQTQAFQRYIFRGVISDTQQYATTFFCYARASGGGWVALNQGVLFQSSNPVALCPEQLFSSAFTEYALIPANLGRNGRLLAVTQLSFN